MGEVAFVSRGYIYYFVIFVKRAPRVLCPDGAYGLTKKGTGVADMQTYEN